MNVTPNIPGRRFRRTKTLPTIKGARTLRRIWYLRKRSSSRRKEWRKAPIMISTQRQRMGKAVPKAITPEKYRATVSRK